MFFALPATDLSSTHHLYESCVQAIRMDDDEKMTDQQITEGLECTMYVGGFMDAAITLGPSCPDGNTSVGTAIRVYVAFVRDNPRLMDVERSMSMSAMATHAFPCNVPKQFTPEQMKGATDVPQ